MPKFGSCRQKKVEFGQKFIKKPFYILTFYLKLINISQNF